MAKEKFPVVTSPPAVAAYAWLTKPDTGHKYSDDKFKVTLRFSKDEDLSELEKAVEAAAIQKWKRVPKKLKRPFKDGDEKVDKDGEPRADFAGIIYIDAKSKFQPTVVGVDRQPLPEGMEVYSGDLIKASLTAYPYGDAGKRGVTFQLNMVQMLEKRNTGGGGGDPEAAFADESDNYDAFDEAAAPTGAGGDDNDSNDKDDF